MKKLQDYARSHPYQTATTTWLKSHPFLTIFLTSVFAFVTTAYWMFWLLGEPFSPWDVMPYAGFAIGGWLIVRGTRKAVLLALSCCVLLSSSAKADEEFKPAAALAIGGAIVVGVGAWVAYKIITCGRRIAAARTNSPPEEMNFFVAGAQDEYAAGFFWPEEYCHSERTAPREPVRFTMSIFVESVSNITTTVRADVGSGYTITFDECKEWAAGRGLFVPGSPQFSESHSRNRQPVAPEQVPITFDWSTRTAKVGAGGVILTVESSDDLKSWQPLARLNVAAGSEVEIPDVSYGRSFYRVTTGGAP